MAERIVLVVGAPKSGKTALIRRLAEGAFPHLSQSTVGLDQDAARLHLPAEDPFDREERAVDSPDIPDGPFLPRQCLAVNLPKGGVRLRVWELGGKELSRELPRGQRVDGILLCYEAGARDTFLRAAHILSRLLVNRHIECSWAERGGQTVTGSDAPPLAAAEEPPPRLGVVLCATKRDIVDEGIATSAASCAEVQSFVMAHGIRAMVSTCAKTGEGVVHAFRTLAAAVAQSEEDLKADRALAALVPAAAFPAAHAWTLPCRSRPGTQEGMTSPLGCRPQEPQRASSPAARRRGLPPTQDVPFLVEVLQDSLSAQTTGAGMVACAPRTLQKCLERGLLHRAVHVWLCVPRTGALLLRKWRTDWPKHPGRWGPTVHGEVRCYGNGGDGHASELSLQAAVRSLSDQIGVDAAFLGELEHWFSMRSTAGEEAYGSEHGGGRCRELVDVYVAALEGGGLPPLKLHESEEVDWVHYGDIFGDEAKAAGNTFHIEREYERAMVHRLKARTVNEDVENAFGACHKIHRGFAAPGPVKIR